MSIAPTLKPTATATITPMRRRATAVRDHLIEVVVQLNEGDGKHADQEYVTGVVRESLGAFPSAKSEPARRRYTEATRSGRPPGTGVSTLSSIDASVVWAGRPGDELVEQLHVSLVDAGYRVVIREKRECAEPGCSSEVMVDWNRLSKLPSGWFSSLVCGMHQYRKCPSCESIYRMSSTNSVEAAPSVPCQVCGVVLVEWGGSKIWQAELVTAST